jgi:hypothetical protein
MNRLGLPSWGTTTSSQLVAWLPRPCQPDTPDRICYGLIHCFHEDLSTGPKVRARSTSTALRSVTVCEMAYPMAFPFALLIGRESTCTVQQPSWHSGRSRNLQTSSPLPPVDLWRTHWLTNWILGKRQCQGFPSARFVVRPLQPLTKPDEAAVSSPVSRKFLRRGCNGLVRTQRPVFTNVGNRMP